MPADLSSEAMLALVLVVLFIIMVNLALFSAFKKKKAFPEIDMLVKAGKSLRRPFQAEEDQLAELSKLVTDLKNSKNRDADHPFS